MKKYIIFTLLAFISSCSRMNEGREVILLSGDDWTLVYADSALGIENRYFADKYPLEKSIPAKVPGSVYTDLMNVKLLPDLFLSLNSKEAYPYAYKEWWYKKSVYIPEEWSDRRVLLNFDGVDYSSKIWINGNLLGDHKGQFTSFGYDVDKYIKYGENNDITILIEAPDSALLDKLFKPPGQLGRQLAMDDVTNKLKFWKCRTITGWDWGTPMWSAGIWQDVSLIATNKVRIDNVLIYPKTLSPYNSADINLKIDINSNVANEVDILLKAVNLNNNSIAAESKISHSIDCGDNRLSLNFVVDNPELWWPNGYGKQNMYQLEVIVKERSTGDILDSDTDKFGIRDIKVVENPDDSTYNKMMWYSLAPLIPIDKTGYDPSVYVPNGVREIPKDSLPRYLVHVNGMPIFLHGGNWIPSDLIYGRTTRDSYEHLVRMASIANYNVFRMWGGGLIEKQDFYDLCDEYGILVWQEMPHAGSMPLHNNTILENTANEQRNVMKKLINHPSIFRYGFANEFYITSENSVQVKQFEDICAEMDPDRHVNGCDPVCEYQRHGPHWFYIPQEYKVYNTGYPLTIGPDNPIEWTEYGASGASSLTTLKKIIPEVNLWPINDNDSVWIWHNAFRAYTPNDWLDKPCYSSLFGSLSSLKEEVMVSQFVQSEGVRYANHANRRAMWHRSGSYMWTFNEPWPNAAHGCIVEYYGYAKPAFYYTKNSYDKLCVSAKYDSISLNAGSKLNVELFAINSYNTKEKCTINIILTDIYGNVYNSQSKDIELEPLMSKYIDKIEYPIADNLKGNVLLLRAELLNKGSVISSETYTFGVKSDSSEFYLKPMLNAQKASVSIIDFKECKDKFKGMYRYNLCIKDNSSIPALFVNLHSNRSPLDIYFIDNYFILLPNEQRYVEILSKDKLREEDIEIDFWNM